MAILNRESICLFQRSRRVGDTGRCANGVRSVHFYERDDGAHHQPSYHIMSEIASVPMVRPS